MDKYTIIPVSNFWRVYKNFNADKCEGEIYGDIFIKERAELVCKLLNENEARKNQNKKYELLSEMVQDIYNKSNSEPQEAMEPLIQLIDKFYNLEADDGK